MTQIYIVSLIFAGLSTAIRGQQPIVNPTGSCGVVEKAWGGAHVPDCQNPLKREYWVVNSRSEGDGSFAAILPRPDGMGLKYELCDDDDLGEIFERNLLCNDTLSRDQIEIINNIPLDEALEITHALHSRLVFELKYVGWDDMPEEMSAWSISPYVYSKDILAMCDMGLTNDKDVLGYCQQERDLCDSDGICIEMAIERSEAVERALLPAINAFYGTGTGTAGGNNIVNPTGSCGVVENAWGGAHVPDCRNPLEREYWVVNTRSEGDGSFAAILPRPDGMGLKYELCDDDELGELFKRNLLCNDTLSRDQVERINNIPLEEALEITHALHSRLVFRLQYVGWDGMSEGSSAWSISPYVPEKDSLAVCDMKLTTNENVFRYCERLTSRCDADGRCQAVGIIRSDAATKALVPAINMLYGIDGTLADPDSANPMSPAAGTATWGTSIIWWGCWITGSLAILLI